MTGFEALDLNLELKNKHANAILKTAYNEFEKIVPVRFTLYYTRCFPLLKDATRQGEAVTYEVFRDVTCFVCNTEF